MYCITLGKLISKVNFLNETTLVSRTRRFDIGTALLLCDFSDRQTFLSYSV